MQNLREKANVGWNGIRKIKKWGEENEEEYKKENRKNRVRIKRNVSENGLRREKDR